MLTSNFTTDRFIKYFFSQTSLWISADGTARPLWDMHSAHIINALMVLERSREKLEAALGQDLHKTGLHMALIKRVTNRAK